MSRIPVIEEGIRRLSQGELPRAARSEWLSDDLVNAYVRFGYRYVAKGSKQIFLTLAVVEVHDPANYGKGLKNEIYDFTERFAEEHPQIAGVYHECVNNPEILPGLRRRGYQIKPGSDVFGDGIGLGADWFKLVKQPQAARQEPGTPTPFE